MYGDAYVEHIKEGLIEHEEDGVAGSRDKYLAKKGAKMIQQSAPCNTPIKSYGDESTECTPVVTPMAGAEPMSPASLAI